MDVCVDVGNGCVSTHIESLVAVVLGPDERHLDDVQVGAGYPHRSVSAVGGEVVSS